MKKNWVKWALIAFGVYLIIGFSMVAMKMINGETGTPEATSSEPQAKTLEQIRDEARLQKESYRTDVTYDDLFNRPNEYAGELVALSGEVIQLKQSGSDFMMRLKLNGDSKTVVMVEYNKKVPAEPLKEEQQVTIYGLSQDLYTYQSQGSGEITIPKLEAFIIE